MWIEQPSEVFGTTLLADWQAYFRAYCKERAVWYDKTFEDQEREAFRKRMQATVESVDWSPNKPSTDVTSIVLPENAGGYRQAFGDTGREASQKP